MKKSLIILGNILIILAVLAAVFLDVSSEQQWRMETKREDFENMTAAMENVTNAVSTATRMTYSSKRLSRVIALKTGTATYKPISTFRNQKCTGPFNVNLMISNKLKLLQIIELYNA